MTSLLKLTAMQLKDRIDFSFLKSKKQTIFKIVFAVLKVALITACIYLAFTLLSSFRLVSLVGGVPTNFFAVVFGVMFVLSIIVCTFGLMKTLYYSKDNQVLLTLPVSRLQVFESKLVVYCVYEFIRNLTFILPILLAYGLANAMPILFYVWIPFALIIYTLLCVAIGSLLSVPALFLSFVYKNSKPLQIITVAIVIFAVVFLLVKLISLIPANIDLIGSWGTLFWDIQDFLNGFVAIFSPLYYLTLLFVGERYGIGNIFFTSASQWLSLLIVIVIIALIFVLTFLLVKPLFFKMTSKPFEYTKKISTKEHLNLKRNNFLSGIHKEFLINYRTSEKFFVLIALMIFLPLSILLLNKIFSAMDTRLSGTYMTIAFNVLMILLVALSSNGAIAKTFSEEGMSKYLIKTNPNPYYKALIAKLILNIICMTISILISVVIFANFANFSILNTIIVFLSLEFAYLAHLLYSASLDIMNPQNDQYATTGTHTNNPNETKSTLIGFLLAVIFALLTFFFISENSGIAFIKIMFICLAYLGINIYMFLSKIQVYYKEKP